MAAEQTQSPFGFLHTLLAPSSPVNPSGLKLYQLLLLTLKFSPKWVPVFSVTLYHLGSGSAALVFKRNTFFIAGREVKDWTWVLRKRSPDGEVGLLMSHGPGPKGMTGNEWIWIPIKQITMLSHYIHTYAYVHTHKHTYPHAHTVSKVTVGLFFFLTRAIKIQEGICRTLQNLNSHTYT